MIKVIQLSKEQCPPCRVLKRHLMGIKNSDYYTNFNYEYYDLEQPWLHNDDSNLIWSKSSMLGIRSLPIVGILDTETRDVTYVGNVRKLNDFEMMLDELFEKTGDVIEDITETTTDGEEAQAE